MASELPWEEKKKSLESILFSTEKRNRDIKTRKVANGRKQRTYDGYEKSYGSSLTVTMESIFFTGVVDSREGLAVAVLDVANAFLHTHNDEMVPMILCDKLTEMMVRTDPSMY